MKVKHREEEIRKQQERECVCSGQEIDEAVNRILVTVFYSRGVKKS